MGRCPPKLIFIGCLFITVVSDICLATFDYFQSTAGYKEHLASVGWLPLVFVCIIIMLNSFGSMPGFHIFLAEVYPSDIRTLSIGLTYASLMAVGSVNVMMFQNFLHYFKFYGTFYGYAFFTAIACAWSYYILPDNRGLSLVQIEENFKEKNNSNQIQESEI